MAAAQNGGTLIAVQEVSERRNSTGDCNCRTKWRRKTTLAPFLLRDTLKLREYVNADPIALGLSGFDPGSVAFEAGRVMLKRLHELASQKRTFAFETTLAARHYAAWIKSLRSAGYSFQLIFLWLRSPELAINRVQERVRSGGHNVPENIIRRRYEIGLKNFWKLYQPLADIVVSI